MEEKYIVYVRTDSFGRIYAVNSSAFLSCIDGWTAIAEGTEDRHHHAQGNYFPGGIMTDDSIPLYVWREGQVITRTPEELESDRKEAKCGQLDALKAQLAAQSKTDLARFLADNPLQWIDGKNYSVTEEKQTLLLGNIGAHQIEVQLNPDAEITWNATGEVCTVWPFGAICALAVAIKGHVKPFVSHQQNLEIAIMSATTLEELEAIRIDYSGATDHATAG